MARDRRPSGAVVRARLHGELPPRVRRRRAVRVETRDDEQNEAGAEAPHRLAEEQEISLATLKRAKRKLQVVTEKSDFQGQTFWKLPG